MISIGLGRRGGSPVILVVDDDGDLLRLVKIHLESEGLAVETAQSAEEALERLSPGAPGPRIDMLVVDVMLPGMDGVELTRKVRAFSDIPVLVLSVRDTDADKVLGLGAGADDYLTKPFSPVELIARVKAALRRYRLSGKAPDERDIVSGEVRLNPVQRRAWVGGREIELTAKEFDLLRLFAENPRRVFTRAQLFEAVWGQEFIADDNTVMVHIRRLRSKIEDDPADPRLIKTVWGIGYRLEDGAR